MPTTSVYTNDQQLRARIPSSKVSDATVSVECVTSLNRTLEEHWRRFQSTNHSLSNGCFHYEFARAAGRVREGVEYAVCKRDGEIVAILPFQRVSSRRAHPVGGMMNDFHGVIASSGTKIDIASLLKQARLSQFDFHALSDRSWTDSSNSIKRVYRELTCPYIDLSGGSFEYRNWLLGHSSTVKRQPQKTRAMERALGPVRMEIDCRDPRVLEQVIEWKRARFRRTRTFDLLSLDWTSNMLREIFNVRTDEFRGMLSVIWAGDQPVAGHFGFAAQNVLHYWFPAHDHQHGRFSPGTELMFQLTGSAIDRDIHRIDLGYGDSELKDRFANKQTSVEVGCVGFNSVRRAMCHAGYSARQALKRIPLKESLKRVVRPIHPNLGKGKFR